MLSEAGCFISRLLCGAAALWECERTSGRPRIYFSNHTSHLDFLKIFAALPQILRQRTHPVAAEEYWQASALRRFICLRVFNAVLVPRSPSPRRRDILQPLYRTLDAGDSLIFFPEGTRSLDGRLHRFRKGLYRLWHARPDSELIPVYLENLNRILPKGQYLPAPLIGSVVFGQPYQADERTTPAAFLSGAREAVLSLSGGRLLSHDFPREQVKDDHGC